MNRLLIGEDWETINQKAGIDVLDIAVNLDNRYTKVEQAELIVERCNLTAKAQDKKTLKAVGDWLQDMCAEHDGFPIKITQINALLRGEFPGE